MKWYFEISGGAISVPDANNAALHGHSEVVKWLFERIKVNNLDLAVEGDLSLVQFLSPHTTATIGAVEVATRHGNLETVSG